MGEQRRRQTIIAGVPVTIVSSAEAEQAEVVVCMRKADATFTVPGCREAQCSDCGAVIVYSQSSPRTPPKRCV